MSRISEVFRVREVFRHPRVVSCTFFETNKEHRLDFGVNDQGKSLIKGIL
jgi:hypothetical protein